MAISLFSVFKLSFIKGSFAHKHGSIFFVGFFAEELAGVEDGDADDLLARITDNHVVIGQFAVIGAAGLLEIDV